MNKQKIKENWWIVLFMVMFVSIIIGGFMPCEYKDIFQFGLWLLYIYFTDKLIENEN